MATTSNRFGLWPNNTTAPRKAAIAVDVQKTEAIGLVDECHRKLSQLMFPGIDARREQRNARVLFVCAE